jgi:hypothetical protein
MIFSRLTLAVTSLLVAAAATFAQDLTVTTDSGTLTKSEASHNSPDYSPFVDRKLPDKILWGDTHLHTSLSVDAGFFGNKLGPEQAYRFARGEEVTASKGERAKLIRPLDFLVIADHALYYGLPVQLANSDPALLADPTGKRWHKLYNGTQEEAMQAFYEVIQSGTKGDILIKNPTALRSVWEKTVATAENYNEPGVFTAINGWEWSTATDGNNLHRVVMLRDDAERARQIVPFSLADSQDVEDLWDFMQNYEERTGGQILAIPHNGNWSNGQMFSLKRVNGKSLNTGYARARQRWEPVYEATQIKGDGETHPLLSTDDEFADFGTWDKGNIGGSQKKTSDMLPFEYARSALRLGLEQEAKLKVNPFKFGMIGATDSHTSLATTREDNFFGKNPAGEPAKSRWDHVFMKGQTGEDTTYYNWETLASGLAGVWARENTREAIWDAFKRREVYATSGSRILVRIFAGWDFRADEVERPDFADRGYRGGVPMGGDLSKAPSGKAPSFIVRALRDPDNANLDRLQIIKGWLDKKGGSHERIYDIACADGRSIKERRCVEAVGNTVNVAQASYTNTIGDPLLTAHWVDPDFDAAQRAFYYVRVLEIPKPSWLAYDARYFQINMPENIPMTVQDRAYTSPIWYTP